MNRLRNMATLFGACLALISAVSMTATGSPATANAAPVMVQVKGTIIDFSPISLTIKTAGADVKAVRLNDSTRYIVNGQSVTQKPTFHYGQRVSVQARQEQDGSLTALLVVLGRAAKGSRVKIVGTIIDFSPISLTIKSKDGDVRAVRLTQNTTYRLDGKSVGQRPQFQYGESVTVVAHVETDGSLTALTVALHLTHGIHIAGTIIDFSPISLTIKLLDGSVKAVRLNADTGYRVNGRPVSQKPTFHYGDHVVVSVRQEQDGSYTALVVYLHTGAHPKRARITGTVIDFSPISLTIKTADGDVRAVRLTSSTRYFVAGLPVQQRPELDYGAHVVVQAELEQDGSYTALVVRLQTS